MKTLTLLLVEDNRGDARLLREMLHEPGVPESSLTHVLSMAAAEEHLSEHSVDVILLDLGLPDAQGIDAVRRAHDAAPRVPLVVLTGRDDEELAGQALKDGAQDYLIKGQIEARGLLRALRYAIERNAMEDALFVEQERAQVTLNCIADAVACTDVSGSITFLNLAGEAMTGWKSRDACGTLLTDVFRLVERPQEPASAAGDNRLLRAVRAGADISLTNDVFTRADGSSFSAEYSSAPMQDSRGTFVGSVIALRDITERRAIERLKDEFVSTVSHELRTPLTSIRASLGILNGGMLGDLGDKARRMLDIAVANTDRLVRLINDILDIERLDSGTVELALTVVDAGDLMADAVDGVQGMADDAGVELALEPCDARLNLDRDRILQTLTNLLGNAIKFSPRGTQVVLGATVAGGVATFCVADRGRGIPQDKSDAIFGRFQQLDASDTREKGGSGLGLAISNSIVKGHGGRMWTERNGDQGSRFLFTLPQHEGKVVLAGLPATNGAIDAASLAAASSAALDAAAAEVKPNTVLIIEDEDHIRELAAISLEMSHGWSVHTACSGAAGYIEACAVHPDAILLDVMMPDMDGPGTLLELRANPVTREIPVIFLTAKVQEADRRRFHSLGVQGVIAKPFNPMTLGDQVSEILGWGHRSDVSGALRPDSKPISGPLLPV